MQVSKRRRASPAPWTLPLIYAMMTSSTETFQALLAICAGNSPVTGEFPAQRPVTRIFGVFFRIDTNTTKVRHSEGLAADNVIEHSTSIEVLWIGINALP